MTRQEDGSLALYPREKFAILWVTHLLKLSKNEDDFAVPYCLHNRIVMRIANKIRPNVLGLLQMVATEANPEEDPKNVDIFCKSLAHNLFW